ncbi:uncharacterized protein BDZ99DRAFT_469583 [Mytilinidion resinicola]|uniref:Uncharacterized protein n=1 Tax=Mytilinidion resinicola TaxID=574789 RepID=A0A6A6XYH1_9PEZI|nr:uncharacterized protein BDZ99DRAFT_469583 [Mytilinidion resinicola]KAF2801591.1 hypothetical protein BDZ99DRAFT_469583 [Mytilinidion resinicola]
MPFADLALGTLNTLPLELRWQIYAHLPFPYCSHTTTPPRLLHTTHHDPYVPAGAARASRSIWREIEELHRHNRTLHVLITATGWSSNHPPWAFREAWDKPDYSFFDEIRITVNPPAEDDVGRLLLVRRNIASFVRVLNNSPAPLPPVVIDVTGRGGRHGWSRMPDRPAVFGLRWVPEFDVGRSSLGDVLVMFLALRGAPRGRVVVKLPGEEGREVADTVQEAAALAVEAERDAAADEDGDEDSSEDAYGEDVDATGMELFENEDVEEEEAVPEVTRSGLYHLARAVEQVATNPVPVSVWLALEAPVLLYLTGVMRHPLAYESDVRSLLATVELALDRSLDCWPGPTATMLRDERAENWSSYVQSFLAMKKKVETSRRSSFVGMNKIVVHHMTDWEWRHRQEVDCVGECARCYPVVDDQVVRGGRKEEQWEDEEGLEEWMGGMGLGIDEDDFE